MVPTFIEYAYFGIHDQRGGYGYIEVYMSYIRYFVIFVLCERWVQGF